MWKKGCIGMFLALMLGFSVQAEETLICAENELVAIGNNGGQTEFFDQKGNYAGMLSTNVGGYEIEKVEKNTLKAVQEDNWVGVYVYDTPIRRIARYPVGSKFVKTQETGYLVADQETHTIGIYDLDGNCVYSTKAMFYTYDQANAMQFEGAELRCTPNGYYLCYMELTSEGTDGQPYHLVGISKDGTQVREIAGGFVESEWDMYFLPEFDTFGDNLILERAVYNLSGSLLKTDIFCTYEKEDTYSIYAKVTGLLEKNSTPDGYPGYTIYDEALNPVQSGEMTDELSATLENAEYDDWIREPYYEQDILSGTPSDLLDGKSCTGFTFYCGPDYSPIYSSSANIEGHVPYARMGEGAVVNVNGEIHYLPLGPEEELEAVNDYLYLTRDSSVGWDQKLRRMDTGEELLTLESSMCCLEKDFLAGFVTGMDTEEGWSYGRVYGIDPETYEVTAIPLPGYSMPWSGNCVVADRSIYRGIADKDGNWIVKVIKGGMD